MDDLEVRGGETFRLAAPKGGIICDPAQMSIGELERMTRRYASELLDFIGPEKDVPAPDMNTNEQTMAWIMDTYSMHARHTVNAVVTGKPIDLGGSRGRREATGRGILIVVQEAVKRFKMTPADTRVVVQGSGNVGGIGALLLHEAGFKVVGISDVHGGIHDPKASTSPRRSSIFRRRDLSRSFRTPSGSAIPSCWNWSVMCWCRQRLRIRSPPQTLKG
jgi:glutamate dehydrogenase (NAD(P)+)